MRHGASLLVSLEGMSRAAFRIANELVGNSKSGLTTRFLSKKLDIPEEEVEYLLDVNHRLLYVDLTKVKLVSEGHTAVRRISEGLENRGDVPALIRRIKGLDAHDFRRIEELLDLHEPVAKKTAAEELLQRVYQHPDSIVAYVASRGFSQTARELFDIVWQSKDGLMPVAKLRAAHGAAEFDIEQALWELFRGFALFEMFRFDAEDRLVRVAGLLAEIRQYREAAARKGTKKTKPKPVRTTPARFQGQQLGLSDAICQLVAALGARPARLRGDGDMFREDRRRLEEIVAEDADPSLNTCLWAAQGVGWLVRVDDTLRAGELDSLLALDRVSRHRILYEWFVSQGDEAVSRKLLAESIEDVRVGAWYDAVEFVQCATQSSEESAQPVLRQKGALWQYMSPSVSGHWESRLARSLEETFYWLGIVDRAEDGGSSLFRITELGELLITNRDPACLQSAFPARKCEFVVQPNFEIVVPTEEMDPLLTVPLDQFATRLSTGQATVYQVTKDSFTQAIQEGHDGDAFVNFLMRYNRAGKLPLNVTTTLEDWRGAMKRVKLRTLHVLESDDPLVIAELMHRRRLRKYFAEPDPKKILAYTGISRADLSKELEKDGFIVE